MENTVKKNLHVLLEHLTEILDSNRQNEIENRHQQALNWQPVDHLPVIIALPTPKELTFPPYPHGETFQNPEKMLFNELAHAFNTSIASRHILDDDLPCTIRANFGTVLIASLFGADVEQVADNPPWIRHSDNDDISLEKILDLDPLDFSKGWCPQVVKMCQFYQSILSDYPELKKLIHVVLPDLQSPFDNLELVIGSNLFAELYSNEKLTCKALAHLAAAQIGFAQYLKPYISEKINTFSHQHATMIKGNILLRNDSIIMMSPEMYRNLVAPYDEQVLRELGGGGVHSCGKADSHVPAILELPSIRCLDLGQPEMNDIDSIYPQLKQRQIPLTRLKVSKDDLVTARIMEKFPTGVSLLYEAESIHDAQETMQSYLRAADKF